MKVLNSYPDPDIYIDNHQFKYLFGGVKFNKSENSSNKQFVDNLVKIIERISPIADDTYRVNLTSWSEFDRILSALSPIKPRNRDPLTKKIEPKIPFYNYIQTLKTQILKGLMDGRHTAFGLALEKQALFYLHFLDNSMNPSFPIFLSELQLKILQIVTATGKVHLTSHRHQITVIGEVESVFHKKDENNNKLIYF